MSNKKTHYIIEYVGKSDAEILGNIRRIRDERGYEFKAFIPDSPPEGQVLWAFRAIFTKEMEDE
jgi:hypothetical protein